MMFSNNPNDCQDKDCPCNNQRDPRFAQMVDMLMESVEDNYGGTFSGGIKSYYLGPLLESMLIALHDSINSPKGVVPKSAELFYCQEYYDYHTEK